MKNNKNIFSKKIFTPVIEFIKNKKLEKALKLLNELSEKNVDQNTILELKGLIYLKKQDWENSFLNYKRISDTKINFEISNNIGVCLYKLGKFSKASNYFKDAIDKNNLYMPSYENYCTTNKLLGKYDLSLKFGLQALEIKPNNIKIQNLLIDILNFYNPKSCKDIIININNEIKQLSLDIKNNDIIEEEDISYILNKSEEILKKDNIIFNYPETQIFRKNTLNLNCERHLSIFTKHKIIPKFCFNCYKVQITLNNVLELIKLYFYFNKLNLKKNNIRKCVIELRKNILGNYKGYIFSQSINEAEEIKKFISFINRLTKYIPFIIT